ncbi:DUF418 domain-containing protein [Streptomyces ochraceiscleroticus]|uniref:DUF418 domain-containing protein n=1 Tax=Streptomyces ochraceiscleroticus TaxID=47761 RepID=A0ABW1MK31_9ACTN|nr:DUF418 domain-containing protein [Streptomyces ochraceiscleroticus]
MAPNTSQAGGALAAPPYSSQPTAAPTVRRLVGVDLARGLAVLGMYAAHVGPDPMDGGTLGFLVETTYGRASALFALLAGFSLVLLTGRPEPRTGRAGRQAVGKVVIRAAVLFAMGIALIALDTQIDVILACYALLFLLALPLYRLRAATLAVIAAGTALILPQDLYLIKVSIEEGSWADAVIALDPLARITDSDGFIEILFTGAYPILTWIPFVIAGMAVARLDLARVRGRLALTGGALAVLGYGGSWLALHLVPNAYATIAARTDGNSAGSAWWSDTVGEPDGAFREWLLVAAPHSQTTFSIVGNAGVALAVLAGCLFAVDRLPRVRRLAAPVTAVGMMSLTAYVLHIVAIWALWEEDLPSSLLVLFAFTVAAILMAVIWFRLFRRGPLENFVHKATTLANRIK